LSGRGLCDELITRPEESYRLCCVVVCGLETSRMGAPYIYDISRLRVNVTSINRFIVTFKYDCQPISYIIRSYYSTLPFRLLYWLIIEVPSSWSSLVLKFHIKNKFLSFQDCCVFKFLVESVSI